MTDEQSAEELFKSARGTLSQIVELSDSAKAAASAAAEASRLAAAALTDGQAKVAEISSISSQAIAAKTQIADSQGVVATKSDHIQKALEHSNSVRAELDRTLAAATQQQGETVAQHALAKAAAEKATALNVEIEKLKAQIEAADAATKAARKTADESAVIAKGLADKAELIEKRVTDYEAKLKELNDQSAAQLKEILGLLPGATAAGLAAAFDSRRSTFLTPVNRWQLLFVGSILAIVVLALTGLWHVVQSGAAPTYDELLRLWLSRLPVAGALVWLALHASRESSLAKRLEEDYGYKSAIASSFLGFHKQMNEVGASATSNRPLAKLCEDTLQTIATPPGRIYEKHELTTSPTKELAEAARTIAEAAGKTKAVPK